MENSNLGEAHITVPLNPNDWFTKSRGRRTRDR